MISVYFCSSIEPLRRYCRYNVWKHAWHDRGKCDMWYGRQGKNTSKFWGLLFKPACMKTTLFNLFCIELYANFRGLIRPSPRVFFHWWQDVKMSVHVKCTMMFMNNIGATVHIWLVCTVLANRSAFKFTFAHYRWLYYETIEALIFVCVQQQAAHVSCWVTRPMLTFQWYLACTKEPVYIYRNDLCSTSMPS